MRSDILGIGVYKIKIQIKYNMNNVEDDKFLFDPIRNKQIKVPEAKKVEREKKADQFHYYLDLINVIM